MFLFIFVSCWAFSRSIPMTLNSEVVFEIPSPSGIKKLHVAEDISTNADIEDQVDVIKKKACSKMEYSKECEDIVANTFMADPTVSSYARTFKFTQQWENVLNSRKIERSVYSMSLPIVSTLNYLFKVAGIVEGPINILEIGSAQGGSAMWFSEHALHHPSSRLVSIKCTLSVGLNGRVLLL